MKKPSKRTRRPFSAEFKQEAACRIAERRSQAMGWTFVSRRAK